MHEVQHLRRHVGLQLRPAKPPAAKKGVGLAKGHAGWSGLPPTKQGNVMIFRRKIMRPTSGVRARIPDADKAAGRKLGR
jgi:hypothetical protein